MQIATKAAPPAVTQLARVARPVWTSHSGYMRGAEAGPSTLGAVQGGAVQNTVLATFYIQTPQNDTNTAVVASQISDATSNGELTVGAHPPPSQ